MKFGSLYKQFDEEVRLQINAMGNMNSHFVKKTFPSEFQTLNFSLKND